MATKTKRLPPEVTAFLSRIGTKGGLAFPKDKLQERARKGGLALAKKKGWGRFKKAKPLVVSSNNGSKPAKSKAKTTTKNAKSRSRTRKN